MESKQFFLDHIHNAFIVVGAGIGFSIVRAVFRGGGSQINRSHSIHFRLSVGLYQRLLHFRQFGRYVNFDVKVVIAEAV